MRWPLLLHTQQLRLLSGAWPTFLWVPVRHEPVSCLSPTHCHCTKCQSERRKQKLHVEFNLNPCKIVEKVNKELPDTRIYVMAVKPSTLRVDVWENAKRVNAGYREIAKNNPQVHYVDSATPFLKADGSVMTDIFVEDGLHLNPMGNLIWGSVIRAALMPQEARYE